MYGGENGILIFAGDAATRKSQEKHNFFKFL